MKHTTESIIEALRAGAWAAEIKLMDIAADRLEELQEDYNHLTRLSDKEVKRLLKERDEARAEVERLKAELNNLQLKTSRPEPSRLEIAAWLKAGWFANFDKPDALACPVPKWWIEQADALIAAAREAK
jgi:predicted  nucleic acid-binding Zn-ribbon protein